MNPSSIKADIELKNLIKNTVTVSDGTTESYVPVYADGERATSDAPTDFIEIEYNGGMESVTDKLGLITGDLIVSLYCKLFSDGSVKLNRVSKILAQFEQKLNNTASENYFYTFELTNFITPTQANYDSGYSVTSFNVHWRTR